MTLATLITLADFSALVDAAYEAETPVVTSAESELGQPLARFDDAAAIKTHAAGQVAAGIHHGAYALWYPSMKGLVLERRITLDPPREGHAFRYSRSGWGLIQLHLYATPPSSVQCRVSVNSEARARARETRYPELGPVADWDWRVVETYAFRLSRRLAAMGRTAPVAPPPGAGEVD